MTKKVRAYHWLLVKPYFDVGSVESTDGQYCVTAAYYTEDDAKEMWGDGSFWKIVQKINKPYKIVEVPTND
jgi:hypothetical protein